MQAAKDVPSLLHSLVPASPFWQRQKTNAPASQKGSASSEPPQAAARTPAPSTTPKESISKRMCSTPVSGETCSAAECAGEEEGQAQTEDPGRHGFAPSGDRAAAALLVLRGRGVPVGRAV